MSTNMTKVTKPQNNSKGLVQYFSWSATKYLIKSIWKENKESVENEAKSLLIKNNHFPLKETMKPKKKLGIIQILTVLQGKHLQAKYAYNLTHHTLCASSFESNPLKYMQNK